MIWLELIRTLWPIAVFFAALVVAALPLWLRTLFPTKSDLTSMEARISEKIDVHEKRLAEGSKQLADLDKRVAVVEQDCDSNPSKADLNNAMAVLAGRMSGVESGFRGLEKQVGTANDYLHTLIQHGIARGQEK